MPAAYIPIFAVCLSLSSRPAHDPCSLKEDFQEVLDAWKNGPEKTPGAEWIIPPARGKGRQVVGKEYPFKVDFNRK